MQERSVMRSITWEDTFMFKGVLGLSRTPLLADVLHGNGVIAQPCAHSPKEPVMLPEHLEFIRNGLVEQPEIACIQGYRIRTLRCCA